MIFLERFFSQGRRERGGGGGDAVINVHAIRGSSHWWYSGKKGILENSCSKIQKKLPGDQSHKTILLLVSTDIDITSSTQGCLKQA